MRKYLNIQSIFILSLLLNFACSNDYKAVSNLNDVSWYTSETIKQKSDEAYKVNVDSFISFMDLSQGTLSHEWIIEKGSKFLVNGFNYKNGNFPESIDPNKGLISNNKTESVLFQTPGKCKVILKDLFSKKVTSNMLVPTEAIKQGDNWLFQKEIDIDVFDKLNPAVKITKEDGTEVLNLPEGYEVSADQKSWKSIDITEGDKLIFSDELGGDRPDSRIWNIVGKTYNDENALISFPNVGTFSNFSIISKRTMPQYSIYKIIPLVINVKATTAPFVINTSLSYANSLNRNVIYLQAGNGSFLQANNVKNDFTVTASTDFASVNIPVDNVEIYSEDNSILKLTLASNIYEGEKVKVSYTPSENKVLSTNSKRELQGFTNQEISNKIVGPSVVPTSAVALNGFDATYAGNYWAPNPTLEFINISTDNFYDGSHSLKVDIKSDLPALKFLMQSQKTIPVTPGIYLLSHYIYIESAGKGLAGMQYGFTNNTNFTGQKDYNGNPINFTFPSETNKWIKQTIMVKYTDADIKDGKIGYRFDFFIGTPAGSTFYLDKIDLVKVRDIN